MAITGSFNEKVNLNIATAKKVFVSVTLSFFLHALLSFSVEEKKMRFQEFKSKEFSSALFFADLRIAPYRN